MIGRVATVSAVVATLILVLISAWAGGPAAYGPDGSVPRWVVLAVLYGSAALIGGLGAAFRRPELLAAAGALYVPGSLVSFGGATFMFVVPAVLLLVAAAGAVDGTVRLLPRDPAMAVLAVIAGSMGALVVLLVLGVLGLASLLALLALAITIENRGPALPPARPTLVLVVIVVAILSAGLLALDGGVLVAGVLVLGAIGLAIVTVVLGKARGAALQPPTAGARP